jgi:hypothetical protein
MMISDSVIFMGVLFTVFLYMPIHTIFFIIVFVSAHCLMINES